MSVFALAKSPQHNFSKAPVNKLTLIAGLGVDGDCHAGKHVQHLSRLKLKPRPANLRQVHLIPCEVLDDLQISPGAIGENVTTSGIDLLSLGRGDRLHFYAPDCQDASDAHAVVVVQGLRNPCSQIDKFREGLREAFIVRDARGDIIGRTAGIMGTVEVGGKVEVGMNVVVEPAAEYKTLKCV